MLLFSDHSRKPFTGTDVRVYALIVLSLFVTGGIFHPLVFSVEGVHDDGHQVLIPLLCWEPEFIDFGYVNEGKIYEATFEIWNNGTGDMPWSLDVKAPFLSVYPSEGSSAGERDRVTVFLDTTGYDPGSYEGNIIIHSEGDFLFHTFFTITDAILSVDPSEFEFILDDDTVLLNGSFSIFNQGEGSIEWSVSSSASWIQVSPTVGSVSDEMDMVFFSVDCSNLDHNSHLEAIVVSSNAGMISIPLRFVWNTPPSTPVITGPLVCKVGVEWFCSITSTDDGDELSYYVDWGDGTNTGWIGPSESGMPVNLSHVWTDRGDVFIRCWSKDRFGTESEPGVFTLRVSHQRWFGLFELLLQRSFPFFDQK